MPALSVSSRMKSKFVVVIVALLAVLPGLRAADKGKKPEAPAAELKIHPKIFSFVEGWLSDGESPVVTELNLDAAAISSNQFDPGEIKLEDGWVRAPGRDGMGFLRYRVLENKAHIYKVAYQENGGGSLTTEAIIECSVDQRTMKVDGKPVTIRVLRILSYTSKP